MTATPRTHPNDARHRHRHATSRFIWARSMPWFGLAAHGIVSVHDGASAVPFRKRQSIVRATLSDDAQFSVLGPTPTTIAADQELVYEIAAAPIAPDAVPGTVKQAIGCTRAWRG
jgi:hypothetical protein